MNNDLQRERRNRVEPRCVERWHLCDDEQFDLAAWFPSLEYRAGHCDQLLYFPILGKGKLSRVFYPCSCNEVHLGHQLRFMDYEDERGHCASLQSFRKLFFTISSQNICLIRIFLLSLHLTPLVRRSARSDACQSKKGREVRTYW